MLFHVSHHLLLGDLALRDLGGVGLPPVLDGRVGSVLERLDEVAAEVDGDRGAGQPIRLELLQVVQQRLQLLGVPRRQLVGSLRIRDWLLRRPLLQHRHGVV
jgi:hypothetical protein